MTSNPKYIGMDVHKESISIAVRNAVSKLVMESVIETKASMILQFIDGMRRDLGCLAIWSSETPRQEAGGVRSPSQCFVARRQSE
jgi:hypothetical protein